MRSLALALVSSSLPPAPGLPVACGGLRDAMGLCALRAPAVLVNALHFALVLGFALLNKTVIDVYGSSSRSHSPSCIAVLLWFLSLFGLLRVRRIPFWDALRLAVGTAFCSILSMLSIKHNSHVTYQAIRMTPVVLPVEFLLAMRSPLHRCKAICTCAAILSGTVAVAAVDARRNDLSLLFAVCGIVLTVLYEVLRLSLRLTTKANES